MRDSGEGARARFAARIAAPFAVALLLAVPAADAGAAKPRYQVEVNRTKAGIPHVIAKDFRSLGYGEGFTYAQDNACLFLDTVVTIRGERSQFFGPTALARNYSNGTSDPNFKSDGFWKWIEATGARADLQRGFGKEARRLYRGWVEGFNAYIRSGKLRDPSCKGQPWVRPISVNDLVLRGMQILTSAGYGNFISALYDAQPPGAGGGARADQPEPDVPALRKQIGDLAGDSDLGSNGLALGSDATQRRTGMLLSNPHFPWRGVDRFWMAHLTVTGKKKYNAMGGTLGGFPMIGVGFNKDLSWTHTVSTGRRFVIRQLELVPGDPTSYYVDGQAVPMTRTTVDAGGVARTYFSTRFGPVANVTAAGYGWTATNAYAITDANVDNRGAVDQYIAMGRARSVGQLLKIVERGGIPFFNTIAADRKGVAMYGDIGRYSNVPQSLIDQCTPPGAPTALFQLGRLVTLDGSKSACTPSGNLPSSQMPRISRRDYVLNSNDSYWLANPAAPIEGITPLIGLEKTIQGIRTRSGNLMTQEVLNRGDRFTLGALQSLFQNDRNHLAELVSRQLANLCTANPSVTLSDGRTVDISEACPILSSFDNTGNLDSPGAWLFIAYVRRAPSGAADLWADEFNPLNPLNTPNQLNTANPAQLRALGEAVQELRDRNIPLGSGLRGVQVATRGTKRISIHGCGQCFQNINSSNGSVAANAPYGEVIQGSSMVLASELRKRGPVVRGILTFSQATDPTSRWFANMTELFSQKKWVSLPFTRNQVRKAKRIPVKVPGARPIEKTSKKSKKKSGGKKGK